MINILIYAAAFTFLLFFIFTGLGIFLMSIDGTEIGRVIDEKIANKIKGKSEKKKKRG